MGNCATIGTFDEEGFSGGAGGNDIVYLQWSKESSTYNYDNGNPVCIAVGQHRMDSLLNSLSSVEHYNITGWWENEKMKICSCVWYSGYCCIALCTYVWARNLIEATIKTRAHQIRTRAHEWCSSVGSEGIMVSVDASPLGSRISIRLMQPVQAPMMQQPAYIPPQPQYAYQPVAPVEYAKPAEEVPIEEAYPEAPEEPAYPEAPEEPEVVEPAPEENTSGMHDPPAPLYDY